VNIHLLQVTVCFFRMMKQHAVPFIKILEMSAKRFEEIRDHVLSLARMDAAPNELEELGRCMWQLSVTGRSMVAIDHGRPMIIPTEEDLSSRDFDPVHFIEEGDERGLRQFRSRLNNVSISHS
jgi:hypothetical protein